MISVQHIAFSYKKAQKVIDKLSFEVPQGAVYGFLGANGSGKTTLIRLMTGLFKPDSGQVLIDGESVHSNRRKVLNRIGTMIEAPSFYGNLTGLGNLKLLCRYYKLPDKRAEEVLDLVGLNKAAKRKTRQYSLGMKQRLGIAMSIVHEPEVLILDEPLNGLDPQGIASMRELFLNFASEKNRTVFISSHILSEIESTCDNICIIDNGKKVFAGPMSGLKGQMSEGYTYTVHCSDVTRAMDLLSKDSSVEVVLRDESHFQLQVASKEKVSSCMRVLLDKGVLLYEWRTEEVDLESMYLKITQQ